MRKKYLSSLMVLCLMFSAFSFAASISSIDLEVFGTGKTYGEAVNMALVEAISRVNGKSIESTRISKTLESSSIKGLDEDYYASDRYQSQVTEATKGLISSYEIIESRDINGTWEVIIAAKVAKLKKSKSVDRKRIVVIPAKVGSSSYSINNSTLNANEVSKILSRSISDVLVQTRKFAVLDRQNSVDTDRELQLATSGEASAIEMVRVGQKIISDFVLVSTIESLSYRTEIKKHRLSEKTYESGFGVVKVSYKLIDVATTQLMYSDTIEETFNQGDFPPSVRKDSNVLASNVLESLSVKLVKKLTSQIYPLSIISMSRGQAILSEGGKSVKIGQRYQVYQRGQKLYDPYTKEFIGYEETPCCTLEIARVAPKQAYAKVLTGLDKIPSKIPSNMFVIRDLVKTKRKPIKPMPSIKKDDSNW